MDAAKNPFAPGAGTQPPELTGRDNNLRAAEVALTRIKNRMHARSSLLIGLRGVGKTVLLNRIKSIADDMGYRTALIESPEETSLGELLAPSLRQMLLQMDSVAQVKQKLHEAMNALRNFAATFDITIGDIGISVKKQGVADSGSLPNDLIDLFVAVGEAALEAQTQVAIFIDELQYVPEKEMASLIAALHRVSQQNLPLVVFGAGLPQLAGLTGKAKSYAERLFEFQTIDKLEQSAAEAAIRDPIEKQGARISAEALDAIIVETEGYPYFLQEWGKHSWDNANGSPISADDVAKAQGSTIKALDQAFFRVRFDRLTPGEKEYLRAMAELGSGPHRSGDIARKLKRRVDQVAPTRANVISKGMVYAPSYGDNAFTVPKFDEYMLRVMPEFEPSPIKKRHPQKGKRR